MDKRFVYHIVSEIVIIIGITFFFFRQKKQLDQRVADLENQVTALAQRYSMLENVLSGGRTAPQVQEQPVPRPQQPRIQRPQPPAVCKVASDGVSQICMREPERPVEKFVSFEEIISSSAPVCTTIEDEIADELAELETSSKNGDLEK